MSNEREPGDQQRGVAFYLDSADDARKAGRLRLAVHLYCAAFELTLEQGLAPTQRVLDGMHQAWLLACEQGDRSNAEAILNDLLPYYSPEQTEEALHQLQSLALQQLEQIGIQHDDVIDLAEDLAKGFSEHVGPTSQHTKSSADLARQPGQPSGPHDYSTPSLSSFVSPTSRASKPDADGDKAQNSFGVDLRSVLDGIESHINTMQSIIDAPATPAPAPEASQAGYQNLSGYDETLRVMRQFGFVDAGDRQFGEFVSQAGSLHGLSGPV
ncbi:MAG: hypothetical protein LBD25_01315, partial [Coriobacteriales bacterium]|nr:hypothetical protein [Coriobacteriales bacterium]